MSETVRKEFTVEGMHCGGCVKSVTGAVSRLPGVRRVDVSLERKAATVEYDARRAGARSDRRRDRSAVSARSSRRTAGALRYGIIRILGV